MDTLLKTLDESGASLSPYDIDAIFSSIAERVPKDVPMMLKYYSDRGVIPSREPADLKLTLRHLAETVHRGHASSCIADGLSKALHWGSP
jgi:hypothetical protein